MRLFTVAAVLAATERLAGTGQALGTQDHHRDRQDHDDLHRSDARYHVDGSFEDEMTDLVPRQGRRRTT